MHIKIDLKIFLFALIFILTNKFKVFLLLMVFALIHELGHLFCGIVMHMKPKVILIAPYGFSLSFAINYTTYNKKIIKGNIMCIKMIIIALAGPAISLLLTIIYININKDIAFSNLIIFVFNMIPIYPLDGGRIVKEIIYIFKGKFKSYEYTKNITLCTTFLITIFISILIFKYKNFYLSIVLVYLWKLVYRVKNEIELKEKIYRKIR